ncbi:hypothetical protein BKA69DRAFT_498720 [Paraphysoderma sedebokerense]|nr:hypothetical protein BKA69DRAFT_498720 [Paraphysoderma sedebokerense]
MNSSLSDLLRPLRLFSTSNALMTKSNSKQPPKATASALPTSNTTTSSPPSGPIQHYSHNQTVGVKIELAVKPGSKMNQILYNPNTNDSVPVSITAPARDNEANKAVLDYIAEVLDARKYQVQLISGAKSRDKIVLVEGVTVDEVKMKLMEIDS